MSLSGGRKNGASNDLDEVSQAAGGQVTNTADIAAMGPTQRAPGMPIRDVSQTPPVTWVFVQGDVSPAAFNVIVPNVEPNTGNMPGRWKAGSPIGGDAWVQGGNSFGATGVLGTNDAFDVAFEAGGAEIMRLDRADQALIVGGTNADASAKVQIDSTTKGFLGPRMTTAQRNAMVLPQTGLEIYNTSLSLKQVNNGPPGAPVWSPANEPWVTGGNSFGQDAALGLNDGFALIIETSNQERIRITAAGLVGIGTAAPEAGLDLLPAMIIRGLLIGDTLSGPIGASSAATVDVSSGFFIAQTTADQAIDLRNPTNPRAGRLGYSVNSGTAPYLQHGTQVQPDTGALFVWNGGNWVPLSKLASHFAYATLAADQAAVAAGTDIVFDQDVTSRGITLNPATGVFSLFGGRTYVLEAGVGADVGAAGITDFAWVDAGTNAVLLATQSAARVVSPDSAGTVAGQPISKVVYTPAANQTVKLRCVAAANATTVQAFSTYAEISELQ